MPFFRANAGTLYAYCSEDIVDVLPFFSEHLSYSRVSNHVWSLEQIIHQMIITHL